MNFHDASLSCMFKAFGSNLLEFLKGRVLFVFFFGISVVFVDKGFCQ